jgi:hypothetical protein
MVRAIIDGRKTQTRRIVKNQDWYRLKGEYGEKLRSVDTCLYGKPGDRLWVRESFSSWHMGCHWYDCTREGRSKPSCSNLFYRATHHFPDDDQRWVPSIHMPRWASRITLEITGVRVERLRDISEADAVAEGCQCAGVPASLTNRGAFAKLWESINGPDSWQDNPWVWVVSFTKQGATQ